MPSYEGAIERLDIELNSSSALREHQDRARQLALALCMEFECAASEIQASLEKIDPLGIEKRSWENDRGVRRRAARRVSRGYKRQAELALAISQMSGKTWAEFVRTYVPDSTAKDKKPEFDVRG